MLVLERRAGQSLLIDSTTEVRISVIKKNYVRVESINYMTGSEHYDSFTLNAEGERRIKGIAATIKILSIKKGKIKIGVIADRSIQVDRKEVADSKIESSKTSTRVLQRNTKGTLTLTTSR